MSHDGAAAQPAEHAAVQPAGRAGRAAAYDGLPLRPRIVNGRAIEDYVVKFRHDRCWRYAYVVVYEQFPSDPLLGRSFVHGHGWEIGSVPPEGVLEIEVSEAGGHLRGLIGGVSCCITLCHGAGTAGGAQDREAAVPG